MAVVGWDFDGVGYRFGMSVRKHLGNIGIEVEPPTDEFCKDWSFFKFWHMDENTFAKHCDDGVDAGIIFGPGSGLTRPGFWDALRRSKEAGHTNIGITHRYQGSPGMAEKNTMLWIGDRIDLFDDVVFSADKTSVPTDYFVEDNLGNYDKLVAAGTKAFLINRPWNHPYDDGRNRISDVSEYGDAMVAIA